MSVSRIPEFPPYMVGQKPCDSCGQSFDYWHERMVSCDLCKDSRNARKARAERLRVLGLTAEQYDAMNEARAGKCWICGGQDQRRLAVDHDHITGRVRGLLCSPCNMQLGVLERLDAAPEWVEKAHKYLKAQG
jgi:hypothetical protein